MNILEDKVTEEEILYEAIPLKDNIGKEAIHFHVDPFSFNEKIHKRPHWLFPITIIGIGKRENCYLVKREDQEEYEIHACRVIRIQNQLKLL